jgi:hypothetical protein
MIPSSPAYHMNGTCIGIVLTLWAGACGLESSNKPRSHEPCDRGWGYFELFWRSQLYLGFVNMFPNTTQVRVSPCINKEHGCSRVIYVVRMLASPRTSNRAPCSCRVAYVLAHHFSMLHSKHYPTSLKYLSAGSPIRQPHRTSRGLRIK